jgi:hypothetical protein
MAGERIWTRNFKHPPGTNSAWVCHGISRPFTRTHGERDGASGFGHGAQGFQIARMRAREYRPTRQADLLPRWVKFSLRFTPVTSPERPELRLPLRYVVISNNPITGHSQADCFLPTRRVIDFCTAITAPWSVFRSSSTASHFSLPRVLCA